MNTEWRHAVGLVTSGKWQELIETQGSTTPEHIAGAVCYGLDYSAHEAGRAQGYLSPPEARALLAAIGSAEPSDRPALLATLMEPSSCKPDGKAEHWPINAKGGVDPFARAWERVIGIEEGWFGYDRAGFLQWAPYGRDRYKALATGLLIDAVTGQGGFAF